MKHESNQPTSQSRSAGETTGLPRQLQVERGSEFPHPSKGGSRGYPVWFRHEQLMKYHTGLPIDVDRKTIKAWLRNVNPKRMTGGRAKEALTGIDQALLLIYFHAYPHATHEEC